MAVIVDNNIRLRKGVKGDRYDVTILREGKQLRKAYDTLEEAQQAVKQARLFAKQKGYEYPDHIIEYLFGNDPLVDIASIEKHFDEVFREMILDFSEREQFVAKARIIEGYTLAGVAEQMGVTKERVRQIESKILRKLKLASRLYKLRYGKEVGELQDDINKLKAELILIKTKLVQEITDPSSIELTKEDLQLAKIESLDFSVRTYNILARHGIRTIADLLELTVEGLSRLRNCGRKSVKEILEKLAEQGYKLKDE